MARNTPLSHSFDVGNDPARRNPAGLQSLPRMLCRSEDLIRTRVFVEHASGSLDGYVWRAPSLETMPCVVVNVGAYALLMQVQQQEVALFATRGYAYVLVKCAGGRPDEGDHIFERWAADAEALLDWLAVQDWCDGRVVTHGASQIGSTAYAIVQACCAASQADGSSSIPGPPLRRRLKVMAASTAVSFSRIQPTVFCEGQSLAVELVLRFLWLVERGVHQAEPKGVAWLMRMILFFWLPDWPGLSALTLGSSFIRADEELWGRRSLLWREGMAQRLETDPFWAAGRDRFCDIRGLAQECPPIRIVTSWWDVFLKQNLKDFQSVVEARCENHVARDEMVGAQLIVRCAGHFSTMFRFWDFALDTFAWYERHVMDRPPARLTPTASNNAAVLLEVYGGQSDEYLAFPAWPPPGAAARVLYVRGHTRNQRGVLARLGTLSSDPHSQGEAIVLSYMYDPASPTPYIGGGHLNLLREGPRNQRNLEVRNDVVVVTTAPFTETVDLVGIVKATLFMQCSAPECDVIARLCIVRRGCSRLLDIRGWLAGLGGGSSMNLCETLARVDFAAEGDDPQEAKRLDLDVGAACCRVHCGDALRLQVCSSAHPRTMRHPLHSSGDWLRCPEVGRPAQLRLFADAARPSSLELPLFPAAGRG